PQHVKVNVVRAVDREFQGLGIGRRAHFLNSSSFRVKARRDGSFVPRVTSRSSARARYRSRAFRSKARICRLPLEATTVNQNECRHPLGDTRDDYGSARKADAVAEAEC